MVYGAGRSTCQAQDPIYYTLIRWLGVNLHVAQRERAFLLRRQNSHSIDKKCIIRTGSLVVMPHSLPSEGNLDSAGEDGVLPDAPPADPRVSNIEVGVDSGSPHTLMQEPSQADIKLDDLFADDDDEDEEFPSPGVTDASALESSPPAGPP